MLHKTANQAQMRTNDPVVCFLKVETPIDHPTLQFLLKFSPPEKKQRILRQRVKQNADTMTVGGALARYMLWKNFHIPPDAQIAYGEFGKPYLLDYPEVHFNISHSGQFVACAVADRPVGVDVQMIAEYRSNAAGRVCSEVELAEIVASGNPTAEFTKLWTRKEAYIKWTGESIGRIAFAREKMNYVHLTTYPLRDAFLSVAY